MAHPRWCVQVKLRKVVPKFIDEWLDGITSVADKQGKIGVLVMKRPRKLDADAMVVLRWEDFLKLQHHDEVIGKETPNA